MKEKLQQMSQIELEDLIIEFYSKQIVQEARIKALTALVRLFAKRLLGKVEAEELMEGFASVVKEEVERLKTDNVLFDKMLTDKFIESLKDIPGIDF